ncbi:Rrf2 family transcriptional regulator [Leeia sp. TBRC 13508]|uniref:Rrf2 family transcriptional regulator n=1 Tax=Leeia speluncae TaxID=2884804 RepID=A0ABS8D8R9_9NEIS|nr:Rrf2 family transcriptional regulator [Leeia speluncae]MCB6184581.1 Rrf2 family transcriptional regulator [Leeia speluncae]
MKLNTFTDYCLRTLIYLALQPEQMVTRAEIAQAYQISDNHLMKVIHFLGLNGFLVTQKGRNGGIRLALAPSKLNIGELVRLCEEDIAMVECFEDESQCKIDGMCRLKGILAEAREAMYQSLSQYYLSDLVTNAKHLTIQLHL